MIAKLSTKYIGEALKVINQIRVDKVAMSKRSYGKKSIPDRWLDYKPMGSVVTGTNFVAFKVPLHQTICENLPEYERHTTREVIETLPELGMVIDLTNTPNRTKYYQPQDWKSKGIDYRWIKCEGHVTPSQELLVHFCRTVKKFMNKNPTKLIGIHCTHGLNRTGYFVCSFMVLVLRIPPHEALQSFADARGHVVERQNYISSIISHHANFELQNMAVNGYSRWESSSRSRENSNHRERNRSREQCRSRSPHTDRENFRYQGYNFPTRSQDYERYRPRERQQRRYHPFLQSHQSGARQNEFGHYQRNKEFRPGNNHSRRRRDDYQNYNN